MIYCDTSLLVSAMLATESASKAAKAWLAGRTPGELAVSMWVETEFASAVAMKVRRGDVDDMSKWLALATWAIWRGSFVWLDVEQRHFQLAATLILEPEAKLRSGDALHLALALDSKCKLATLDGDLRDAADRYGIAMEAIAASP